MLRGHSTFLLVAGLVAGIAVSCSEPSVGPLAATATRPEDAGVTASLSPTDASTEASSDAAPVSLFPRTASEANAFLRAGAYKSWKHDLAPHFSKSILHPYQVIPYVNSILDASLAAKASTHPIDSMAVKEFFDDKGNLIGWAFSHKTRATSEGGAGWYWYEVLSTTSDAQSISGDGIGTCTSCHEDGNDFFLSPYPLLQ